MNVKVREGQSGEEGPPPALPGKLGSFCTIGIGLE